MNHCEVHCPNCKMFEVKMDDFEQFLVVRIGLSPNSVRHCLSRYKVFSEWTSEVPSRDLVDQFIFHLKKLGRNNNTLNTYVFFFDKYYKYLQYKNIECEDFRLESFKKVKPSIEILTPREIKKILATRIEYGSFRGLDSNSLNDTYTTLTHVLATTGARYSEVAKLKVEDIREDRWIYFSETKNREWRRVPINPILYTQLLHLAAGKKKHEHVFTSLLGNKIASSSYSADLRKRAELAGIKKRVHPHLFRHAFATQLLIRGATLAHIQTLTGHKDISSLQRYLHLADEQIKKTAMSHDLNRAALSVDEVLDMDFETLQKLLSVKDDRFEVKLERTKDGIKISVEKKDIDQ